MSRDFIGTVRSGPIDDFAFELFAMHCGKFLKIPVENSTGKMICRKYNKLIVSLETVSYTHLTLPTNREV